MDLRDVLVAPIVIILVCGIAYLLRNSVTDRINRVYFMPALTIKLVGALAVGVIYQFYYHGGDTFTYHTHGSRHVWDAFMDSPPKGLKLLFGDHADETGIYKYSSKIFFYNDRSSYSVVRIAAVLDLITFSSYAGTALLFAAFSFVGMWMFFLTFYERYPHLHRWLAIASFFIPSVFFWGSGLLKDTITIGFLGVATYQTYKIFVLKKVNPVRIIILLLSLYAFYAIKIYILLIFLPSIILWIFLSNLKTLRSRVLKIMLFPFVIGVASTLGYYAMVKASEDNEKYALSSIAKTAQITAYDIRYWTGRDAGSGYTLGELDGTFGSMINLAPQAINVSLFRPYLWEVKNPLMFLAALESLFLLLFSIYILLKLNVNILKGFNNSDIVFSILFSISFAFAVGVSTFNFGSLVRYKIPMMPFFLVALILLRDYSTMARKLDEFEETE